MSRLDSRTSSPARSIWLDLSEEQFRQHVINLEKRTNAVPIEPQSFDLKQNVGAYVHTLPLHVEQQLADDFAFLAAVEEGAQSVAAVCLEEHVQPAGLTVRFAALDLSLSDEVRSALKHIADVLASSSCGIDDSTPSEMLFKQITKLHFRRLLARLRSIKWTKPEFLSRQHKKPLWQDFANLIHRVQFLYSKREVALRYSVEAKLRGLVASYEAFEIADSGSKEEFDLLLGLVKASYHLCKAEDVVLFAQRLEDSVSTTPTSKVASAIKCLRQIEKIAAHWRIATSLVTTSRKYPPLFKSKLQLAFLTPYKSVPTAIGYETWATTCHVHAEVQLAVYYDLQLQSNSCVSQSATGLHATPQPIYHRPRVIGTSKWLCYLCYLFLRCHECFVPANTHGRLYDQWTVPDLADYGDQLCARYRNIVRMIDQEVITETRRADPRGMEESKIMRWRPEPMTSRQNLIGVEGRN